MGQVVADTTPISTLAAMGLIDILPSLYGHVVVPDEVAHELRHPKAPINARLLIDAPPPWLTIRPARRTTHVPGIHIGEAAAIQLAIELHACLIIDDRRGWLHAESLGVHTQGTVGVLEDAANNGIITDLAFAHQKLRKTPFRVTDEILNASLVRHQKRKIH